MKTSSDFLWQLIHSLSPAEKLFFKRNFVGPYSSSDRLYLRLFDALAGQKKFNESAILSTFQPALHKKNIASQKHYLQNLICEALIDYDGRNSTAYDIYQQIRLIGIYRKKGLLSEAHATWKKAVQLARRTESFALLNLLKTEFEKMILFSNASIPYDELHAIFKGHIITYNEYADMITLRDIYTEVLLLKRKSHFDIDEAQRKKIILLLASVDKIPSGNQSSSFWFRYYHRMSKATLLYLLSDIPGAMTLLREERADWKDHVTFITTHGEYYIELLYMINYAGILAGAFDYVMDAFSDVCNELIEEPVLRANFEAIKYLAFNKIYNKTARYDDVKQLVQPMKQQYGHWEPLLNTDMNRTVSLSLGIACFVLEQFDDAYYYSKKGIDNFREGARDEHLSVAHLLLLLICFSLNNPRVFEAQYRVSYNFFHKRKKKHRFETALIHCLHRVYYMKETKEKIKVYEETLDIFRLNEKDPIQRMTFGIFNFAGWLRSRVLRISYRQYVERSVKESSPS